MVLKFEPPDARVLNFPKNSAPVLIRLVLINGDCVYLCGMYILHTLRWNTKLRTQMQSFKYILTTAYYICILIYCTHTHIFTCISLQCTDPWIIFKGCKSYDISFSSIFPKKIKMFTSWYEVIIHTSKFKWTLKCFGLQK